MLKWEDSKTGKISLKPSDLHITGFTMLPVQRISMKHPLGLLVPIFTLSRKPVTSFTRRE